MKQLLSKFTGSTLDLLFPIQGAGCLRESQILCEVCVPNLAKLTPPYCQLCASPKTLSPCSLCRESPLSVDRIRAPFLMEGAVREAIFSLKYRGVRSAAPRLGWLLAKYMDQHKIPGEVMVPVPLHRRRLRSRGYNQSALLARELSKLIALPLENNLLTRFKDAPPQVEAVSQSQRRSNVDGSFQCTQDVGGLQVLLVDDVVTTGSTMSDCALALKDAGAASVWGLALAREDRLESRTS